MKFFSKLVFICNLCFVTAFLFTNLGWFVNANAQNPEPLDIFRGTIVVIAEFGWILNFLFLLIVLLMWLFKKQLNVGKWLLLLNALIFVFQFYYYFIDKNDSRNFKKQTHSAIHSFRRDIYC
jgi:hypothetical protein